MIEIRADVRAETALLPQQRDLLVRLQGGQGPEQGGWQEIEPASRIAGHPCGDVILCHARNVWYLPRHGLLLREDGEILQASLMEIPGGREGSAVLPGMVGGRFQPPRRSVRLARGAVWMGFGAVRNYGHFLFDGLTALNWMQGAGLPAQFPALAPGLRPWQRALVTEIGASAEEIRADAVALDEVIFTTCLNHYLHRSGALLRDLADRLAGAGGHRAIYMSRRGFSGRILVNEAALEARLATAGVQVLRPERMTVAAQRAALDGAGLLIGPSGAALANLCFLAPGSVVVEIRPQPVNEPWLSLAAANLRLEHRVVAASGALSHTPLWVRARQAPRALLGKYHYAYEVDIPAVLAACGLP